MSLNNDFRTNRRTYNERGGFFGSYTGVDNLYPAAGPYSINTSSHILSAGINLLTLFAPAGIIANSTSVYSTVNAGSASWNNAYTTANAGSANWNSNYTTTLANSANWSSVYTTTLANSANWSSVYTTTLANSANWSGAYTAVAPNSASWNAVYSSYSTNSANFVDLLQNSSTQGRIEYSTPSAGILSVDLSNLGTGGSPTFQNLTINNNLSVLGDFTFLNTSVTVTSALSVVNNGTGPALFVKQGTGTQPIAYFIDADGSGDIIFANNGFVGLGTATPNERLTVVGNISSTAVIYALGGNSNLWNSTYTTVNANSANGASVYTTVNSNSANYILDGGNTKGANITIGTIDNFNLNLETNNATRLTVTNAGNVGIGTQTAGEKLTVAGNISSSGAAYLSGAILTGLAQTGTTTGNRLVTVEANGTLTYNALPANTSNVNGLNLTYNRLTKSTSTATTLTASTIVDTGSSVQIDRNVSFIQTAADNLASNYDVQIIRNVFTGFAATSGTPLSTFPVQINVPAGAGSQLGLLYSRHNVLLYVTNGNRTAFEVVAGHTTTAGSVSGTVFGIIDVGAPTLLNDVDVFNNGGFTSLILNISSTSTCKVVVESIGYYGSVI
jgi:hypothetical protein